jgi:hypothetical protein
MSRNKSDYELENDYRAPKIKNNKKPRKPSQGQLRQMDLEDLEDYYEEDQ